MTTLANPDVQPQTMEPGWYRERGEIGARYWDGSAWWTDAQMKDAHRRFVKPHVIAMLILSAPWTLVGVIHLIAR